MENKIEALRLKLYEAYQKDPDSKEVLIISQSLDRALNQLDNLLGKSKSSS
ncbi:Spo0E family sporulation regulatory protein-aspartic acid phosphatase [Terrihalobacillus insolitus]|uniref:Spo0E family sporulation regulatory protein-aspartic acid phosphatase n=1 Tax=Terrihalobacillus insolitus TaxID=2950438 RepID=UPI003A90DC5D